MDTIRIRGARTHNLRDVDLDLPRDALVVITGPSGSGKSSLAFDTLFAEGQRRYVESLSAYARQFLSVVGKPDVDLIDGLSPAIAIGQKTGSTNPRSTVGTITEVHDYLRLLYARIGTPHCPLHGEPLAAQSISAMVDATLARGDGARLAVLAPLVRDARGDHADALDALRAQGYLRARIDGRLVELDERVALDAEAPHAIDVVVDRVKVRPGLEQRLAESFETATALGDGVARVAELPPGDAASDPALDAVFSLRHACRVCGYSVPPLEPRAFSFNSPDGACPDCDGLGVREFVDPALVVVDPRASLAAGALRGLDRRNAFWLGTLRSLGTHYGFDVDVPFEDLPEALREIVLHGGDEPVRFDRVASGGGDGDGDGDGDGADAAHPFEGVVANLERRRRENGDEGEGSTAGDGLDDVVAVRTCPTCEGARLNAAARHVTVAGHRLEDVASRPLGEARALLDGLGLEGQERAVGEPVLDEVRRRLTFLVDVGLDYLSLDRGATTLSGGEAQRIRLASQIGAGLQGVLYVLDEPSIGLHQRDVGRLLGTLRRLRDLGNTVVVVEHDEDAIRAADHVVDVGPGAGVHGGRVVASGTLAEVLASRDSPTGAWLSGRLRPATPVRRAPGERWIEVRGARGHNLKGVDARVPLGLITAVTGVSGSGKSTLVRDTLLARARATLHRARDASAPVDEVAGLQFVDRVVAIDQSPIGRTPRSNPATYTGLFAPLRELFAGTREARARGYTAGRFSFNVRGGRCEACRGDGLLKVEMHFLPDVYVPCDVCRGRRYNRETLDVRYKGLTISEVLDLDVERARTLFAAVPAMARRLDTLVEVGLGYVTLGQNATTLSGGEAQRIKLARELSKPGTGATLYVLDEPTTGLHFGDVAKLLDVLRALRDAGNTVLVVEHNLDVVAAADWVIDLGPEGGAGGGRVVAVGTPEEIAACEASHTGSHLAPLLGERAR